MILAYINQTIPIPNIESVATDRELVGATNPTKGGKLLRWATAVRKIYTLQIDDITKQEYDAIISYLEGIFLTETWFWMQDFGGDAINNSRRVLIDITDDVKTPFNREGVYHYDGRSITLEVKEVE